MNVTGPIATLALIITLAMIITGGCDLQDAERGAVEPRPIRGQGVSETEPGVERFTIESHGKFHAGFGNNEREILLITDRKTGKVYLGITGVGISELRVETTITTDADGHTKTESETVER